MIRISLGSALASACLVAAQAGAVTISQSDNFQDGLPSGWGGDMQEITIETDGGPAGLGDRYLSYSSFGEGQAASRMVIPNEVSGNQWSGDYSAAGISGIRFDVLNAGVTDLALRLAIADNSTWYVSTDPISITNGGVWMSAAFQISEDAMTRIGSGANDFATVVADVQRIRVLSSVDLPPVSFGGNGGAQGDRIAASIGLDNITAFRVPEPTALLLAGFGFAVTCHRRR